MWEQAEKEAATGNANTMNRIGRLYYVRDKDYAQALHWYEKAAAAGNADAMDHLGELYEHGQGVK